MQRPGNIEKDKRRKESERSAVQDPVDRHEKEREVQDHGGYYLQKRSEPSIDSIFTIFHYAGSHLCVT